MEPWQRIGTYAAGLALDAAGVKGNAELLGAHRHDRRGRRRRARHRGRQRDPDRPAEAPPIPDAFLNERLMSDLRPTLFLAQLSNLLAGNISIVHGVTGSSRTFMGEEAAGVDAVRIALRAHRGRARATSRWSAARYNAERRDLLLLYEFARLQPAGQVRARSGSADPSGGFALGSLGAFLVLEARAHARGARREAARPADRRACPTAPARARRGDARRSSACGTSSRRSCSRRPGAVISGATGAAPATAEERAFLAEPRRRAGARHRHLSRPRRRAAVSR